MVFNVLLFSDEQSRICANLAQFYSAWMTAKRQFDRLPYGMQWKLRGGQEYLYEIGDREGRGTSLGPRSPDLTERYLSYTREKNAAKTRIGQSARSLKEAARIFRSLRLPMIDSSGGKILRAADQRGLLGTQLLVVGTNAMPAYALEAAAFIPEAPMATMDFDLAWVAEEAADGAPIAAMLKAADPTYTRNTERDFQALNAAAYEVEILVAPSRSCTLSPRDWPMPVALPEQEWLTYGRPVDQIVVAFDGSPARIVAPDPRWFALQKLWMSEQDKRNPLKRQKDLKQGMALLSAVAEAMPHYPLDHGFVGNLPAELRPHFQRWQEEAGFHSDDMAGEAWEDEVPPEKDAASKAKASNDGPGL